MEEQTQPGDNTRRDRNLQATDSTDRRLVLRNLDTIVDLGVHDVYDIEAAPPHSVLVNGVAHPQCQSMLQSLLPVVREVISHSQHGAAQFFTGTPLTTDNTLTTLWDESSQAEWFVPCSHCTSGGFPTWNIPAAEFDLEKMIGPWHEDISEDYPGTICHKCRQPISPRMGRWVHRYAEKRWSHAGYHIPQILIPHHYASPKRWGSLLAKQQGLGPTPTNVFYNEVLGTPYDRSANLVSDTELRAAAVLGPNTDEHARRQMGKYMSTVLAVDWGGGGEDEISLTTLSLLGMLHDGTVDVLWGKRLLTPHDHLREALEVRYYWNLFQPQMLAHDYAGSGALRETFLIQSGLSVSRILPCMYVRTAHSAPCYHVLATEQHPRDHYRVDKARTLQLTCTLIKLGQVRFFQYDYVSAENTGLIRDFLALKEEKTKTQGITEVYRIDRFPGKCDDFAQSVNYGCVSLWYVNRAWPNLLKNIPRMTAEQIALCEPDVPGWLSA